MARFLLALLVGTAVGLSPTALAAVEPARGAYERVTETPRLPRVLLIGDSISEGYTVPVRDLLREKANVYRIPENGGPTTNGLTNLTRWLQGKKWDVIHFNWGLHDLKIMGSGNQQVSPETYEANLRELVRQLQATGATLMWASTTPVPVADAKLKVNRRSADVLVYNAVATRVMKENHIAINDLYAFALPQLAQIQMPVNVYYTPKGYQVLGEKVATSIGAILSETAGSSRHN